MNFASMMIDISGKRLPPAAQLFTCTADGRTDWSERPDIGKVCTVHCWNVTLFCSNRAKCFARDLLFERMANTH